MEEQDERFKPPYMSFQTFWNFIDDLGKKPLPPQIDRSLMDSKSGTDQANLTAALKTFGLIRNDLVVEPILNQLVNSDEEGRKRILHGLVEQYYAEPLAVSAKHGTEKQLNDSFRDSFGMDSAETRRKSLTFFLHAAKTAGFTLSEHFPAIRSGAANGGTPRAKRKRAAPKPPAAEPPAVIQPTPEGDTYRVTLRSGGTVSLTVSVSHFALSKNKEDRNFVNGLVDALTEYGEVEEVSEGEPTDVEPIPGT